MGSVMRGPKNIRVLLLLLVGAVWLPAVVGFGLLARSTYIREADGARNDVRRLADNVNLLVERELDKRLVTARTLGASAALARRNFAQFYEEASAATRGTTDWVVLVDRTQQVVNTHMAYEGFKPLSRGANSTFIVGDPAVFYTESTPTARVPGLGAFAAELSASPPGYNVIVAFEPQVVQSVVAAVPYADSTLAAVINQNQTIIARSREPEKWIGKTASPIIRERVHEAAGSFVESVTLDGVPSLTYVSRPNRHGWNVVIALPQAALARSAERLTMQALAASGVLMLFGLGIALFFTRRLSAVVVKLRSAAAMVGTGQVPPPVSTGVAEMDDIGVALHRSAVLAADATRTLEAKVQEAVDTAKSAQAKLLQSQKLEAMGRLTGGVAHDFNNLLAIINTNLHIQKVKHPDQAHDGHLQAMGRAIRSGVQLTRQLLSFSRKQSLHPESIPLGTWLPALSALIRSTLGRQNELEIAVDEGVPPVLVDAAELELALINLAVNARHAMPNGGAFRITATAHEDENPQDGGGGRRSFVEICAIDQGVGIAPDVLPHVIEPFYTTRERGVGSGLGLAQVNGFCEQAGGTLHIDTALGRGTRVCMRLPAAPRDAGRQDAGPASEANDTLLRGRLLLVEDNTDLADSMQALLGASGLDVVRARSAQEALEFIADLDRQSPDVVLSDIAMPGGLTGIDLALQLRTTHPLLPVLLTTGFADKMELAVQSGFDVLQKPVDPRTLLERLRECLTVAAAQQGRLSSSDRVGYD